MNNCIDLFSPCADWLTCVVEYRSYGEVGDCDADLLTCVVKYRPYGEVRDGDADHDEQLHQHSHPGKRRVRLRYHLANTSNTE